MYWVNSRSLSPLLLFCIFVSHAQSTCVQYTFAPGWKPTAGIDLNNVHYDLNVPMDSWIADSSFTQLGGCYQGPGISTTNSLPGLYVWAKLKLNKGYMFNLINMLLGKTGEIDLDFQGRFKVLSSDPAGNFNLTVSSSTGISLGPRFAADEKLVANNINIAISSLGASPDIQLSSQLSIQLPTRTEPLVFQTAADIQTGQKTFLLTGNLGESGWSNPFGWPSLTFTDLEVKLEVNMTSDAQSKVMSLVIFAQTQWSFSQEVTTTSVTVFTSAPKEFEIVVMANDIPLSILNAGNQFLGGLEIPHWIVDDFSDTSSVNFVLSTSSTRTIAKGMYITATGVELVNPDTKLMPIVKAVRSNEEPIDGTQFTIGLYADIFEYDENNLPSTMSFYLKETRGSPVNPVTFHFDSYSILVNMTSEDQLALSGYMSAMVTASVSSTNTILGISADGGFDISESSVKIFLNGTVNENWNKPLGWEFLTLHDLQAQVNLTAADTAIVDHFAITGKASWSFSDVETNMNITFQYNGTVEGEKDYYDFTISTGNVPLAIFKATNHVFPTRAIPAWVLNDVSDSSYFNLVLSSYEHDDISKGLQLTVDATTIKNPTSDALQLAKFFNPTAAANVNHYKLSVLAPIYYNYSKAATGAEKAAEDELRKTLVISLTDQKEYTHTNQKTHLNVLNYKVSAVVSDDSNNNLSAEANMNLTFAKESPLTIQVSGVYDKSDSTRLSLKGSIATPWIHPFGIDLVTLKELEVEFSLTKTGSGSTAKSSTSDFVITSEAEWSFESALTTKAGLSVSESSAAGGQDYGITLYAKDIPLMLFPNGIKEIFNWKTYPSWINDLSMSDDSKISITLSNYAHDDVKVGLLITANAVRIHNTGSQLMPVVSILNSKSIANQNIYTASLYVSKIFKNSNVDSEVSFSLTESGNFPVVNGKNHLICHNFTITIDWTSNAVDNSQLKAYINTDLELQLNGGNTPNQLMFNIAANYNSKDSTVAFGATELKTWTHPLGLQWLDQVSGANLTILMDIKAKTVTSLEIDGNSIIKISPQNEQILKAKFFMTRVNTSDEFVLQIEKAPFTGEILNLLSSNGIQDYTNIWKSTTSQTTIDIYVSNIASTYEINKRLIYYGLTVIVADPVKILSDTNKLFQNTKWLNPTIQSSTAEFLLSFYVGIFGKVNPPAIMVNITESRNFTLSNGVRTQGYSVSFMRNGFQVYPTFPKELIALSAFVEIDVDNRAANPDAPEKEPAVWVNAAGTILVDNVTSVDLQGTVSIDRQQNSLFKKPLGQHWLSFKSATINLHLSKVDKKMNVSCTGLFYIFYGYASASFDLALTSSKDGASNKIDSFFMRIKEFPSVPDLSSFLNSTGYTKDISPFLKKVLAVSTFDLVLTTEDKGGFKKGLTADMKITLPDKNSDISKLVCTVRTTTTQNDKLDMILFFPIYRTTDRYAYINITDSKPFVFGNGKFNILSTYFDANITNLGNNEKANMRAGLEVAVTPKQSNQIIFIASASYSSGSNLLFNGEIAQQWVHPFGLSWLTLSQLKVALSIPVTSGGSTSLTISALANAQFINGQVAVQFGMQQNFQDWYIQVLSKINQNLIAHPGDVASQVSGHDGSVIKSGSQVVAGVSLMITSAPMNEYQQGLTLTTQVSTAGDLKKAIAIAHETAAITYGINAVLYVPLFSKQTGFSFNVSSSTLFKLGSWGQIQQIVAGISTMHVSNIYLYIDLHVFPKNSPVLDISVVGSYQIGSLAKSIALSGSLNSHWVHPFGIKWLTVDTVVVTATISPGQLSDLSIYGEVSTTISPSPVDFNAIVMTNGNFGISVSNVDILSMVSALYNILEKKPQHADDLVHSKAHDSFYVVVNNFKWNQYDSGLTIGDTISLQGDLKNKANLMHKDFANKFDLSFSLYVPIFTNPSSVTFTISAQEQFAKGSMKMLGISLILRTSPVLSITAKASTVITFKKNPPLQFDLSGQYITDGTVIIGGDMMGTWSPVFGLKGVSLSDVVAQVGFNPANCAVTFCIADIGMGYTLQINNKIIKLYANIALPDVENLYAQVDLDGANGQMFLSLGDFVGEWNKLNPNHKINGNVPPIGLKYADLYFATAETYFQSIHVYPGFKVAAAVQLWELEVDIDIEALGADGGKALDFKFAVHFHLDVFHSKFLQHLIDFIKSDLKLLANEAEKLANKIHIFHSTSMDEFHTSDLANGNSPNFKASLRVLGNDHNLNIPASLDYLSKPFHNLWVDHFQSLFKIQWKPCVSNKVLKCKSGYHCHNLKCIPDY